MLNDNTDNALKTPKVKLANLVGGVGATIWIITPAAIGALAGTLTKRFSASVGFMWGALLGATGVATKVITGFPKVWDPPKPLGKKVEGLHDMALETGEEGQETAGKEDILMTHAQRVTNRKETLRAR